MSKLTKNGKNLILENTIVSYSPKDDTIHITSADPDLYGEPFHISLNQSSQTENALRKLLIEQGVITEDRIGSNLPENLTIPGSFSKDSAIFDLGISRHGVLSWNPAKDSHLGIFGYTGSGKTVIANNILFQALKNQDMWDIYCIDPKQVEYKHVENKLKNPNNYVAYRGEAIQVVRSIHDSLSQRVANEKSIKPIILFIDEFESLLSDFSPAAALYRTEFIDQLKDIIDSGRESRIHVVFTSQRPISSISVLLHKTPSSIVMGKADETVSKTVLNSNIALRTPKIKGRGYFKFGNTEPAQFQAYYIPLSKFEEIPEQTD